MGRIDFPLINIRKDVNSKWHLKHFTGAEMEEITVASDVNEHGYYTAWLKEVPDSGASKNTTPPKINGLIEFRGQPINPNTNRLNITVSQFFVNY